MLIGHYAPALLLKRARPDVPLWALFVAVETLDFLWSGFVLAGLEHVRIVPGMNASNALDLYDMPLSHSLVAAVVWGLVGAVVGALAWRGRPGVWSVAAVFAVAVTSHFALDLVVHVRDLPLAGAGSAKLGFGLWNSRPTAIVVESVLFVASALVLWRSTALSPSARRRFVRLGGGMSVGCVVSYFVPTPPSAAAMAVSGLALYVGLAWVAWSAERPPRV